jgi:hypothetical protein
MTAYTDNLLSTLGFLRIGLFVLALLNILPPLIDIMLPVTASTDGHSFWSVLTSVITPVMAPLLMVVLLFDYLMSRMRAADATGSERASYVTIGRIELAVLGITLLFWVPFFTTKMT